jgi:hypothetical protein
MRFASTIAGMSVCLIQLLHPQELLQHSLVTTLAHRQRQFFAIQADYLSTPTAPDRQTILLGELFFVGKGIFDL